MTSAGMRHTTGLRLYFRVSHADSLAQSVLATPRSGLVEHYRISRATSARAISVARFAGFARFFVLASWGPVAIETVWKPRFAAVPPDVRWRLRPTGGSTPNHSGATPLSWGIAPDSINSSRKDTAQYCPK